MLTRHRSGLMSLIAEDLEPVQTPQDLLNAHKFNSSKPLPTKLVFSMTAVMLLLLGGKVDPNMTQPQVSPKDHNLIAKSNQTITPN